MAVEGILEAEADEAGLHPLMGQLVRQLDEAPSDRARLDRTLVEVVGTVRRILSARFGDGSVIDEAADSALRTFLRRVREDGLPREGADAIERFLVETAFTKAYRLRSRIGPSLVADPVDPTSAVDPSPADPDQERERARIMNRYLRATIARMESYLKNERHRRVFRSLLRACYGGPGRSHEEIAAEAGCSVRTVERVHQTFRRRWQPLVEEARREFRDLMSRFEEPGA